MLCDFKVLCCAVMCFSDFREISVELGPRASGPACLPRSLARSRVGLLARRAQGTSEHFETKLKSAHSHPTFNFHQGSHRLAFEFKILEMNEGKGQGPISICLHSCLLCAVLEVLVTTKRSHYKSVFLDFEVVRLGGNWALSPGCPASFPHCQSRSPLGGSSQARLEEARGRLDSTQQRATWLQDLEHKHTHPVRHTPVIMRHSRPGGSLSLRMACPNYLQASALVPEMTLCASRTKSPAFDVEVF